MPRKCRPLSRVPGFRPAPYIGFRERMYSDVGITEEDMNTPGHVIEYEGRTYVTPPIIENDDGKENDGRAAD